MRKLSEVDLEREELSTKVDEANQTIGALRFENNFLVEETKKSTSDKIGLGYDHSLSSCSTSSNTLNRVIFVLLANNDNSEVIDTKTENVSEDKSDKGKSILGAPFKVGKKEIKQNNHRSTNKKSQPKKPHFCHYCAASGHTRLNFYK